MEIQEALGVIDQRDAFGADLIILRLHHVLFNVIRCDGQKGSVSHMQGYRRDFDTAGFQLLQNIV